MPIDANFSKRYREFRQKKLAARSIQTAYRRYRQRSTDQRQLGSILRSHRSANPYQITPSSGRTVTFWRKTQTSINFNQGFGWGAAGLSLSWGFSLGRIVGFLNGAFQYSLIVSNASEFQSLFDYYTIKSVKMQIFFSKTNADYSIGPSQAMPIILIANDFDDIAEPMTLNSMNERVGCRTVQFDATNTNGINHYVKPKPTSVVVQTNVDTGVLSASNSGVVFGTQWLDTAQSNIVHNGIKLVYDNQGRTTSVDIGTMTFVFDVEYVMKGYR